MRCGAPIACLLATIDTRLKIAVHEVDLYWHGLRFTKRMIKQPEIRMNGEGVTPMGK